MFRKSIIAQAVLCASMAIQTAVAATLWVSPKGLDRAKGGSQIMPYKTLAYAGAHAISGDVIRLIGGEFCEKVQTKLPAGVTILGAGSAGCQKTVVYAPRSWNYSQDGWTDNEAGYLIKCDSAKNCSISGIEFRGNAHSANGALLSMNSDSVIVSDVAVYDFRMFGMKFCSSQWLEVRNCHIENSGFEKGPDPESEFPDGGSLGNLGLYNIRNCTFHDITLKTTGNFGYGIKMSGVNRCSFYNIDFAMYPFSGEYQGNFDLELFGSDVSYVEMYNCTFRQTLSFVGGNVLPFVNAPYTVHLHHNAFLLDGWVYGIEMALHNMVIDHNYFTNTWSCVQNFGDATTRLMNETFCYNICDSMSSRVLGVKGKSDNVRVFNNTVSIVPDSWQSYLLTIGSQTKSENWTIVNNCMIGNPALAEYGFMANYETEQSVRNVNIANNCFYGESYDVFLGDYVAQAADWDIRYSKNQTANPLLLLKGPAPQVAFYPMPKSPLIDKGDNAFSLRQSITGKSLDVGAYEFGELPWMFGPHAQHDITYLWAPISKFRQRYFADSIRVDLASFTPGAQIRYTLDGSEPTVRSLLYTGTPILVTKTGTLIQARTFKDGWGSITTFKLSLDTSIYGYPNMGQSGKYSASSSYDSGLYGPDKAFDDELESWIGWNSAQGDQCPWLQTDMGQPYQIKALEMYTRRQVDGGPENRSNFEIQASNDSTFSTFSVLYRQESDPLAFESDVHVLISDRQKYRFVRVKKTAPNEFFFVGELRVCCDINAR